jgi:hypothetical protein
MFFFIIILFIRGYFVILKNTNIIKKNAYHHMGDPCILER